MAHAFAFVDAARRYWLSVFPCARNERRHWRLRAGEIVDPALRRLAVEAQQTKRDSVDGAIAFATFVPRASRQLAIRALTAYQVAFDYIDTISEQPSPDPIANGYRLNAALLDALATDASGAPGASETSAAERAHHPDYYAHHSCHEDAGYLWDLIDTCRTALSRLPAYGAISEPVRAATSRVVSYQALNHGDAHGSLDAFTRWARAQARRGLDLRWWEVGAAAGSPLPVFALIAAAAKPSTDAHDALAVGNAYFPWIASLNSLLDNLIDRREDAIDGQRNLLDYYDSPAEATKRMQTLATRAVGSVGALADGEREHHTLILAAMAGFYHAAPGAAEPDARLATQGILDVMVGDFALPSALLLRLRRCIGGIAGRIALLRSGFSSARYELSRARRELSSTRRELSRARLPRIRNANSGIEAFAARAPLAGSSHATTDVRDVSRIPALGDEASPAAPALAGEVSERAPAPRS
jgi:tetraprenyl-beta-curcumene synthase